MHIWRYKTRRLSRLAREAYSGVQITTKDWAKFQALLLDAFERKGERKIRLEAQEPTDKVLYFTSHLVGQDGVCIFIRSLTLQFRPSSAPDVKVENFDLRTKAVLSEEGLCLLLEGAKCLSEDSELDEWVIGSGIKSTRALTLHPYPKHPPGLPLGTL